MKRDGFSGIVLHEGLIAIIVTYFCVHGYVAHYGSVFAPDLLILFSVLLVIAIIVQSFLSGIWKDRAKATVFTSMLLLIVLFFGVFQDIVAGFKSIATLARLTIFFPVAVATIFIGFYLVRKAKSDFRRLRKFLTILMFIYLLVDLFSLVQLSVVKKNAPKARDVILLEQSTRAHPSVYLVLLDEYVGNETLNNYYGYSNNTFRQFLADHRFHVIINPSSNYHLTVYSMASLFNMSYLDTKGPAIISNHYAYKDALQTIEKNRTCDLFRELGYRVINKSLLYFDGQPPAYSNGLLPDKMNLVQHQTMYYRVARALPQVLAEQFGIRYFVERNAGLADANNNRMMNEVLADARITSAAPSFTYLHLMMPHEPMIRDSLGNKIDLRDDGTDTYAAKVDTAYLQYLVYTNRKISGFIDSLQQRTKGEAVIMLMSDHGSRHLARTNRSFAYNNLHAVYFPKGNYGLYYSGVSNVNAFPLLFKTIFGKGPAIQRDSVAD